MLGFILSLINHSLWKRKLKFLEFYENECVFWWDWGIFCLCGGTGSLVSLAVVFRGLIPCDEVSFKIVQSVKVNILLRGGCSNFEFRSYDLVYKVCILWRRSYAVLYLVCLILEYWLILLNSLSDWFILIRWCGWWNKNWMNKFKKLTRNIAFKFSILNNSSEVFILFGVYMRIYFYFLMEKITQFPHGELWLDYHFILLNIIKA